MQLGIHNARGDRLSIPNARRKALELYPDSYSLRARLMWTRLPRWGGSYESMETIAREAESRIGANPRLAALYGFIYLDQADVCERRKAYPLAEELCGKAIAFGDDWSFYEERASLRHYELEKPEEALADIEQAIELRPTQASVRLLASRIHFAAGRNDESLAEYELARKLEPEAVELDSWSKWAAQDAKERAHKLFRSDVRGAVALYDVGLRFDPRDADLHCWRAQALAHLERPAEAIAGLEEALRLDPRRFETYQALDRVLLPLGQLDRIIGCWDRFLALEPQHAAGYFERSGTHHHRGNVKQSLADLRKACDLGSSGACDQLEKMSPGPLETRDPAR
jgi:tetratricopeptide (TPR) repeat protein